MEAMHDIAAWFQRMIHEHWLPLLILFAPLNWVVYQSDADNAVPFFILPVIALIVGFLLKPRHAWFVWLGSVFILWIVIAYMGKFSDTGPDETPASIVFESFIWMFAGVFVPVWLGRLVRFVTDGWHNHDQTHGRSAH